MEDFEKRIETNPKILLGKPVIKGTRISVSLILDLLASGMTPEEIIKEYPHLKLADIQAATKYAACLIEKDRYVLHSTK